MGSTRLAAVEIRKPNMAAYLGAENRFELEFIWFATANYIRLKYGSRQ